MLTDEQLAEIHERVEASGGSLYLTHRVLATAGRRIEVLPSSGPAFDAPPHEDVATLLIAYDELRAENAVLSDMLKRLTDAFERSVKTEWGDEDDVSIYEIDEARALLAKGE